MPSLFDGVTSLLAETFGDGVTHIPAGSQPVIRQWVFREERGEIGGEDGHAVLGVVPILRVPRGEAYTIKEQRDRIEPGDGKTYLVLNQQPSGTAAADAFVLFELECVS